MSSLFQRRGPPAAAEGYFINVRARGGGGGGVYSGLVDFCVPPVYKYTLRF